MTIFMTFLQCKHMMKYVAIQLLHELNTNQCLKRFYMHFITSVLPLSTLFDF